MTDLRKAAEQALEFCEDIGDLGGPYPYVNETAIVRDSRKVLQALRQALAQPEQEPVAYYYEKSPNKRGVSLYKETEEWQPLYTAPPKLEWVELTNEDIHNTEGYEEDRKMFRFAKSLLAKAKEKNT